MSLVKKLETSLIRPFKLLFTQPIIIALAVYMAYLYGLVYLVISSFSELFTSPEYYGESTQIAGLNYIALAIGYFFGAQITARFNDWLYRRLKQRNGGKGKPEFRIPVMIRTFSRDLTVSTYADIPSLCYTAASWLLLVRLEC